MGFCIEQHQNETIKMILRGSQGLVPMDKELKRPPLKIKPMYSLNGVAAADFKHVVINHESQSLIPTDEKDPRYLAIAEMEEKGRKALEALQNAISNVHKGKTVDEPTPIIDDEDIICPDLNESAWRFEQRFTVVGFFVDGKLELHFKVGLDKSFSDEELEDCKERGMRQEKERETAIDELKSLGLPVPDVLKNTPNEWQLKMELRDTIFKLLGRENVVTSKPGIPGHVHEESISYIEKTYPHLKGKKTIGLSFWKKGNQLIWLNRSSKNLDSFERSHLAIFCNLFNEDTNVHDTHDFDYHLHRSAPIMEFEQIISQVNPLFSPDQADLVYIEEFDSCLKKDRQAVFDALGERKEDVFVLTKNDLYYYDRASNRWHTNLLDLGDAPITEAEEKVNIIKQSLQIESIKEEEKPIVIHLSAEQLKRISRLRHQISLDNLLPEEKWETIRNEPTELQTLHIEQLFMLNLCKILLGEGQVICLDPARTGYETKINQAFKEADACGLKINVNFVPEGLADPAGASALILASRKGALTIMKMLLEREAEINAVDKEGNSAIFDAAHCGNIEAVKILLAHKDIDLTIKNKGDRNVYEEAVHARQFKTAEILAKTLKLTEALNEELLLLRAVNQRNMDDIQYYLDHYYKGTPHQDALLETILLEAAEREYDNLVLGLIHLNIFRLKFLEVKPTYSDAISRLINKHNEYTMMELLIANEFISLFSEEKQSESHTTQFFKSTSHLKNFFQEKCSSIKEFIQSKSVSELQTKIMQLKDTSRHKIRETEFLNLINTFGSLIQKQWVEAQVCGSHELSILRGHQA